MMNIVNNLRNVVLNNRRFIEQISPQLLRFIENVPENAEEWMQYQQYIMIFASEIVGLLRYTKDAEQMLVDASCKSDSARHIQESYIIPLLIFIERHLTANREVEIFQDSAKYLREKFMEIRYEVERLYEDIIKQMLQCREQRENVSILRAMSCFVGVGTGAVALVGAIPESPLSLPNPAVFGLAATSLLSLGAFTKAFGAVKMLKDTRDSLDQTRSMVVELKIKCQSFITTLDVLYFFKRLYTEGELREILQSLAVILLENDQ